MNHSINYEQMSTSDQIMSNLVHFNIFQQTLSSQRGLNKSAALRYDSFKLLEEKQHTMLFPPKTLNKTQVVRKKNTSTLPSECPRQYYSIIIKQNLKKKRNNFDLFGTLKTSTFLHLFIGGKGTPLGCAWT